MLRDLSRMAFNNISRRRLRSFLTVLGVIVGVLAIVGIISLGNSLEAKIYSDLEKFGSDTITIIPERLAAFGERKGGGFPTGGPTTANKLFTESDLEKISKIEGVESAYGSIATNSMVEYYDESAAINITAPSDVDAWVKTELEKIGLETGRSLSNEDRYSAVVGYSIAHEIFSKDVGERKTLLINDTEFKVVGILNKVGGILNTIDQSIYIPIDTARQMFASEFAEDEFSRIYLKVSPGYDTGEVSEEIHKILFKSRDEDENTRTFTVLSPEFYQETVGSIMGTVTGFLGSIAAISLITGGIGITNIMYASVMERTREIGIMKAVGATDRTILLMVVLESGITGLIGGIIGDILGVLFAYGLTAATGAFVATGAEGFTLQLVIRPEILILGCLAGFTVGVLAGYFPARKAAKLQPVDALRYE